MALDYSITLRNNRLTEIQTTIGSGGILKIFSGPEPANCAAPDPTGLLITIGLPFPFITVANAATTITGSWTGTTAGTGDCASFRMYDSSNNCHVQGAVPADMVVTPSSSVVPGEPCQVVTFTVQAGNP